MLYHLFTLLTGYISGFNLFRYIPFRTAAATITAILISLLLGSLFIRLLKKMRGKEPKDVLSNDELKFMKIFTRVTAYYHVLSGKFPKRGS